MMPEVASLKQVAYARIRDWILEGELRPADPIHESEIARRLSMSRTPVRAALETLVEDGLAGLASTGTIFVQTVTVRAIREMFEMRAAIESFAILNARTEPIRHTLERLVPLIDHYRQAGREIDVKDRSILSELDVRIHTTIVAGLQNTLMSTTYQRQLDTRMAYLHGLSWADPDRSVEGADGHARLVEALLSEKRRDASQILHQHLESGRRYVTEAAASEYPALNQEFSRAVRVRLDEWISAEDAAVTPSALVHDIKQTAVT